MNPPQADGAGGLPVSPKDVVEYLVQNEPLTHIAEISRCVDEYTSQLKQDSFTIESLNAAADTEKRMTNSIDELLRECQGFYSVIRRRMKEAENVIDTRSQDLQQAISRSHSTPLTTPPVSFLGITTHPIAQTSDKVEEISSAQTEVLNDLEASRNKLKATLGELPNRGMPMESLLNAVTRHTYRTSPSLFERDGSLRAEFSVLPLHTRTLLALASYDSLQERYQRGSQELQSGVDKIVKNSETIRDLALVLERARDLDLTTTPLAGNFPTLAEELSVWQAQNADTTVVPPPNPRNQALHWISPAVCFDLLKAWAECSTRGFLALVFAHLPVRPSFLVSTSLVVLFVLANVMRVGYHIGNPNHGRSTTQTATSSTIRDLLFGDKANMSDELIRNLVPRG